MRFGANRGIRKTDELYWIGAMNRVPVCLKYRMIPIYLLYRLMYVNCKFWRLKCQRMTTVSRTRKISLNDLMTINRVGTMKDIKKLFEILQ